MLIPIRHENMEARRWPVITIGLIVLNTVIFLLTNSAMERESPELGTTKAHIILLAAAHPELNMSDEERDLVEAFKKDNPTEWDHLQSPMHDVIDAWDARMRMKEDQPELQADMDTLAKKYRELASASVAEKYAFVPAHKKAITYLTANFLHGGWLHLIGRCLGTTAVSHVLSDRWGCGIAVPCLDESGQHHSVRWGVGRGCGADGGVPDALSEDENRDVVDSRVLPDLPVPGAGVLAIAVVGVDGSVLRNAFWQIGRRGALGTRGRIHLRCRWGVCAAADGVREPGEREG